MNKVNKNINMYSEEKIELNCFYGFRQLTEISVKDLSPGINDTGTAIICVDFITSLLACKLNVKNNIYAYSVKDKIRLFIL